MRVSAKRERERLRTALCGAVTAVSEGSRQHRVPGSAGRVGTGACPWPHRAQAELAKRGFGR